MKHLSLFIFLLLISFTVSADFDEYVEKPYSFGFGTYRTVIAFDNSAFSDDELTGISLSFSYIVSDAFSLRASYFSLDHDDFSDIDSTGYDFLAYFGTGLAAQGFKVYIGGGLFKDKWEVASFSKSFDGLQLNGGIGYNWESVSLDFILGIRDASEYEEFVSQTIAVQESATAISSSFLVSYRF